MDFSLSSADTLQKSKNQEAQQNKTHKKNKLFGTTFIGSSFSKISHIVICHQWLYFEWFGSGKNDRLLELDLKLEVYETNSN